MTQLVHKVILSARQRKAVNFGQQFVIADCDIENLQEFQEDDDDAQKEGDFAMVLHGFNPEQIDIDRRILFELTGIRLNQAEFSEDDAHLASQISFGI